ncbi:hypothetical protein Q6A51_19010 [Pseudomonas sp. KFB-139]|uniref:Uncharacterized protein n=1 Tax=Pseudomonas serbiensis TaxID=3064350 RepID=A0ABT9CYK7_9PSED|nr:hypothetical protein [Pseudomonas sp. KFB-138]MDO7928882.1 hypothetical protein [Pseudomonas sp. KFB-138]
MTQRDFTKPLPVIDGPHRGEWYKSSKDYYSPPVVWDARRVNEQPPSVTYHVRRHTTEGLVWACNDAPDLSDP